MDEKEKKSSADLIVDKIKESNSQILQLTEKTTEEFKSVGDKIVLALKESSENKAKDEIKSLEDKLANKEAEIKSLRSGHGISKVEVKSLLSKAFSENINDNKFSIKNVRSFIEQKSNGVVGFDAKRGGIFLKQPEIYGEVVNLFPRAKGISALIKNIDVRSDVVVRRKDNSKTAIYETLENKVAQSTKGNEYTEMTIEQKAQSVKIPVSAEMLKEIQRGETSFDLVSEQVNDLVDLYNYKKDQLVVVKSIEKSQAIASVVKKSLTASADSTNGLWGFADILACLTKFEKFYRTPNMVFVADQSYLDKVFAKVAADGHGNMEYFEFNNGFTSLKSANGLIRLVGVDSEFFANYKKFDNNLAPTSNIATTGFDFNGNATANGGKVLGMFVDLSKTMLLCEDQDIFEVGLYQDAKDTFNQEAFFGLYGSYGLGIILEASMGILVHKN